MKKTIITLCVLLGAPSLMFGQSSNNEMYFFSSPNKETETKKETRVNTPKQPTAKPVERQETTVVRNSPRTVFIPSGVSTVVQMESDVVQNDVLDQYNRRHNTSFVEVEPEPQYLPPTSGGEWINGFEGSDMDYQLAERMIRNRNQRYSVHISSPYYWDVAFGLNSFDWNIYKDDFYVFAFPRHNNPRWSSWAYGPSFSFGYSGRHFGLGFTSGWSSFYDPFYSGRPWGWGGGWGGSWGHHYYPGYYPSYYPGHHWGGWGGGYYSGSRYRSRRGYRDNRRYDGVSSWSSSTNNSRYREGSTTSGRGGNRGDARYTTSSRLRGDNSRSQGSRGNANVQSTRPTTRPSTGGTTVNTNQRPGRTNATRQTVHINRSANSVRVGGGNTINSGTRGESTQSMRYTRPSSTRSSTIRNASGGLNSRSSGTIDRTNPASSRSTYSGNSSGSSRSTYSGSSSGSSRSSYSSGSSSSSRSSGGSSTRSSGGGGSTRRR